MRTGADLRAHDANAMPFAFAIARILYPAAGLVLWRNLLSALFLSLGLCVFLTGCTTPIGTRRVSARESYREAGRNALSADSYSDEARLVLYRYDLDSAFKQDPERTLLTLHRKACEDDRRDLLYALSELNYLHAERLARSAWASRRSHAPNYYLAAAIYAYFYLLGGEAAQTPVPFDRRFRVASDLYNYGLAFGLADPGAPAREARFAPAKRPLPQGTVSIDLDASALRRPLEDFEHFLPADDFRVHGLTIRDRQSGMGAPFIGVIKKPADRIYAEFRSITSFLKINGDVRAWSSGTLTASLHLYDAVTARTADLSSSSVPLQTDNTAPVAYALRDSPIWKLGAVQFFSSLEQVRSDVYLTETYVPGRIPVVFVHGTFSSPVWWAEMWNTLRTDPTLRERFQFWVFVYNSGNPVSTSANKLRSSILKKIEQLDPEGKDPALRQMVVVGHSQGGLLTKLVATDTGAQLWHTVTSKEFESLAISPELKDRLRPHFFFKPLPCVGRVVFVSTPHRGSYRATGFARSLARLFMTLPKFVADKSTDFLNLKQQLDLPSEARAAVPTSLDGMSPHNPFLLTLAEIPVASGIKAHSIIAINDQEQPPNGGDGVVKYDSAHVGYVESEFVAQSGHSCQDKPAVIEEVRRILIEHLRESRQTVRAQSAPH